jgi:hypothetical protein
MLRGESDEPFPSVELVEDESVDPVLSVLTEVEDPVVWPGRVVEELPGPDNFTPAKVTATTTTTRITTTMVRRKAMSRLRPFVR